MALEHVVGLDSMAVVADLIGPLVEVMTADDVRAAAKTGDTTAMIAAALKGHGKAVATALAVIQGEDPDEYIGKMTPASLMKDALSAVAALAKDSDAVAFLSSQATETA